MSGPLETRSLPGAVWEQVPEGLRHFDEDLQAWFASHISVGETPWKELQWLTESREGIGIWILIFAGLLFRKVREPESRRSLVQLRYGLLALGPLLVLSDWVSVLFKRFFGRLKPHVNFYNPDVLPALSLPSSHAFNLAFIATLLTFGLSTGERQCFARLRWVVYALALIVSLTRVFFGQHYPLDVLVGWVLGAGFALLVLGIANGARRLANSRRHGP